MRGLLKFFLFVAVVGYIATQGPALFFRYMGIRTSMSLGEEKTPFDHTKLPDLSFAQRGSSTLVSLNSCPTPKCLTFYEAPWCSACRAASPSIKSVRDYLNRKNVTTRIIVGDDSMDACQSYADEYGPDTLLDSGFTFHVPLLPYFIVSDSTGTVLKAGPFWDPHLEVADLAKKLGLP